jgi:SAM-dependent methyltransferase
MPISPRWPSGEDLSRLLPPELLPFIDARFARSCDLIEEYTSRLALDVFKKSGLADACRSEVTADEAIERAGFASEQARVPVHWLLAMLAERQWIDVAHDAPGAPCYCTRDTLSTLAAEDIAAAQTAHDPTCLPCYRIAALASERYPAVLHGEASGEEALFSPGTIQTWFDYFSNANPAYAISNKLGAIAAERAVSGRGAILEIGGGLGSAAEALIERLESKHGPQATWQYTFTELSALFLRRGRRMLTERFPGRPLTFASLDINRPFEQGGIGEGAFALVYGVNVLHVARDLAMTLAEIRRALVPGGVLVIAESVRPFAGSPIYIEFAFNLLDSFRAPILVPEWRPNGGFLTPGQWHAALTANGFVDVETYPDIDRLRDSIPSFVVAAITARRS